MMSNSDKDLNGLDLASLSEIDLRNLLGPIAELRKLLALLQTNDQLKPLLLQSIIEAARHHDGFGDDEGACKAWREQRWGDRVEEAFLDRRRELDQVSFWMAIFSTKGMAMETFYQLCNEETSFDDLALTNRKIKCHRAIRYGKLTPALEKRLRGAGTSKPQMPVRNNNGFLITQVVEQLPAQLDDTLSQQLLAELEQNWANRELNLRLDDLDLPHLSIASPVNTTP